MDQVEGQSSSIGIRINWYALQSCGAVIPDNFSKNYIRIMREDTNFLHYLKPNILIRNIDPLALLETLLQYYGKL